MYHKLPAEYITAAAAAAFQILRKRESVKK